MRCPKCSADNTVSRKFCRECGEKVQLICPQCKSENTPGDKFCGECGHKLFLSDTLPPVDFTKPESYTPKHLAEKILSNRSAIEGERKLVTVLFADVANYTAMSEKLDPEIVHQIMDGAFKIIMDEIHGLGGTINQFTGDGVMALFGAPAALEDHAQRACKAALAIQSDLVGYSEAIDRQFQMRIGLNSGYVVVGSIGDDLRMDYTAVGDTTNLAARIQQAANPGEVWISEDTHHIVQGYFDEDSLGEITFKGKSESQAVYRIITERANIQTRFQAGLQRGVTEMVGRKPEMAALETAYEKAAKGEAQLVDISGEAGVGKSRLVHEFSQTLDDQVLFLTGVCVDYGRNINFLPLIDIVRTAFNITGDTSETETKQIISSIAKDDLADMVPFYQNLLSIKVDDPNFAMIQPEGRKFGTFEAIKKLLFFFSAKTPLIIFIEDVHWIDKISEEFFTYFARHSHGHRILIIANYRPEYASSWSQVRQYQKIVLATLSSDSSAKIAQNMLGETELEPTLEKKIVDKTGGNPFFVEEIIRELIDRGDIVKDGERYIIKQSMDELIIPTTVQGVLAARMDRLSEDLKQTMQIASVIGRDFAFRILKKIMTLEKELREHLTKLVGIEILYEKALYPELEYIFTHALTQEVAYESLLMQRRKKIHEEIAQTIEELYENQLEKYYELLAHHYEKSENNAKTVHYLLLAGEKAKMCGANQAALEFFTKTLEIVRDKNVELDPDIIIRLHLSFAEVSYAAGDYDKSLSEAQLSLDLSRLNKMVDEEKQCIEFLSYFLHASPDNHEIREVYRSFRDRAKEIMDKGLEGTILSQISNRHSARGDYWRAYQLMLEADKLSRTSKEDRYRLYIQFIRSMIERWIGHPQKNIELTEGLGEIACNMGHYGIFFWVESFRGISLAETGRIEDGITVLKHAIDIAEEFEMYQRIGALYNSLGYCYNEIYQTKKSLSQNQKGQEISISLMERYPAGKLMYAEALAQSKVNIVENFINQNKFYEAINMIEQIRKESDNEDFNFYRRQWETRLNYSLANVLIQQDKIEEAKRIVLENIDVTSSVKLKKRKGSFLRLLGEIQLKRNELSNAADTLKKSIKLLENVGNPRLLWETYSTLAITYDKLGRLSKSSEAWGAAKNWINTVADGLSDLELKNGFLNSRQVKAILSENVP